MAPRALVLAHMGHRRKKGWREGTDRRLAENDDDDYDDEKEEKDDEEEDEELVDWGEWAKWHTSGF